MNVYFDSTKLKRLCEDPREARKAFGDQVAKKLTLRINELINAPALSHVPHTPPARLHQLSGHTEPTFAVVVHRGVRIVLKVGDVPIPYSESGGVNKAAVHSVIITFVGDYHE